MKQTIFREFSIRGQAERDLPDQTVYCIGRAIGQYFYRSDDSAPVSLILGRDVRQSSPRLSRILTRGLLETGINVIDLGFVPTPVLNFAVDHLAAQGGIMVTASHNPPADNGFKLRAETTLMGQTLQDIYQFAHNQAFPEGEGLYQEHNILADYLNALKQRANFKRPLKIVIDGGNGANGLLMTEFLRSQGHEVVDLFTEPVGTFPNRSPDPTKPGSLKAATALVLSEGADCGLAYDGDGDRLVLIDEQGQVHLGDTILILLARYVLESGPAQVVYDISCTQAVADDIKAQGGQAYPAPVGYAFIHERLLALGASLGGEASGHIFCLDDVFRFDDAMLASVKLLNYLTAQTAPLSSLIADLPHYHTSPNFRIFCPDNLKFDVLTQIESTLRATYPLETIDGIKAIFPEGWALVRRSKTQPALTIRAEGESAAALDSIQACVLTLVQNTLRTYGVDPDQAIH